LYLTLGQFEKAKSVAQKAQSLYEEVSDKPGAEGCIRLQWHISQVLLRMDAGVELLSVAEPTKAISLYSAPRQALDLAYEYENLTGLILKQGMVADRYHRLIADEFGLRQKRSSAIRRLLIFLRNTVSVGVLRSIFSDDKMLFDIFKDFDFGERNKHLLGTRLTRFDVPVRRAFRECQINASFRISTESDKSEVVMNDKIFQLLLGDYLEYFRAREYFSNKKRSVLVGCLQDRFELVLDPQHQNEMRVVIDLEMFRQFTSSVRFSSAPILLYWTVWNHIQALKKQDPETVAVVRMPR